jgi:uncharacterized protein (TIGR03083 family)
MQEMKKAAPVPPIDHDEAHELARTAYRRLADLVKTFDADDWSAPTDCEGWTVRDMVGHLVGAMRSASRTREMGSQLVEIRRRVRRLGGNQTDHMTAVQIRRTADLAPAELVAECAALVESAARGRHRTPRMVRNLVRIPVDLSTDGGESQMETWKLGYLNDVILTRDTWLHRIDLCRALGIAPELTAQHDGRIVADVAAEWARRHGRPYDLTLTGPAGGRFASTSVEGAEVIVIDAVDFCRILSGRSSGAGLLTQAVPF